MDDDLTTAAETALRSLAVPEDVAARHLAMLTAPGTSWLQAAPDVTPIRSRRSALRATAGGVALGAALLSGAGVAAASTAAPGDPLYGLKTAREHVQLAMARHGDDRARLELKLARTRLGEAAGLLRSGKPDRAVETLARADAALASAMAQGGSEVDAAAADELDHRVEVLGNLLDGGLPVNAADAAREALDRALDRRGRAPFTRPGSRPAKPDKPAKPDAPRSTVRPTDPPRDVPSATPTPKHPDTKQPAHPTGKPTAVPAKRK